MKTESLNLGVVRLRRSLRAILAHLEWYKLKTAERRSGDPPVFASDPQLEVDIRNEQSRFMALAADTHDSLNVASAEGRSPAKVAARRQKLLNLEAEFHALDIPKTF